jgi:serine/threonine protein kinase/Tol biopolymer transport system component
MPVEPGARLNEYVLLQPIGSGGMGEVWLARDTHLGRKVALKLLPVEVTRDPGRVARFEREARAASALNHPNVCTILALGKSADGQQYIAMEHVEGTTLRARMEKSRPAMSESLRIVAQIASALSAAHAAGIVHRDLKPENVMLRPDGTVKVLDFGLAKLVGADLLGEGDATHTLMHTGAGTVVGTISYMAPEQARGQEVDSRADIWALGVVVYELVAGQRPFGGATSSDVLVAILDRDPMPLSRFEPGAPVELQRIVRKALKKDREQRYQTVRDLWLDLQALGEEIDLQGRTPADFRPAGRPSSTRKLFDAIAQHKLIAAAALLSILGALSAAGWYAMKTSTSRDAAAERSDGLVSHNLVRLTFDAGLQTDISWSPDGRSVAYASDAAGNFDIWVQPVDGGEPVQVTRSPANDTQPAWSPDGGTIVFHSDRDGGGLFIVPASGGPERRLTPFGSRPRWAPDGSRVLFASTDLFAYGGVPAMYTVRLDGQPPRQVLQPLLKELSGMTDWNWYPDSRRVSVLGSGPRRGFGIYTGALSGSETADTAFLKYTPELGSWGSFEWADSGATLYVECGSNWARNIAKFKVDPQAMKVLAAERVTAGDGWETKLTISRDGKRLAFTMGRMSLRLWSFPFDAATARITGAGEPVTDADAKVLEWDLSRDGARLAYRLARVGAPREEFWTTDLGTGESRRLARDEQSRSEPHWSRDGNSMAFQWTHQSGAGSREQALAVRRMSTGDEQLIMTPRPLEGRPVVIPYDWSPDGQWILASALVAGSRSLGLWPLAAAPHAETAVKALASDSDYFLYQAKFSPNGRWICFQAVSLKQPGVSPLFVMPSAGADRSGWARVTGSEDWADKPRWSPDGKLIYFIRRHDSFFNLWAVPFDDVRGRAAAAPFQVTHFDSARREISPSYGAAEIGVSEKRLILTIMEQTGNVWVLDNVDR